MKNDKIMKQEKSVMLARKAYIHPRAISHASTHRRMNASNTVTGLVDAVGNRGCYLLFASPLIKDDEGTWFWGWWY